MSTSVTMPQLGETVTEGTVSKWLLKVGDLVAQDQPLVEISTDKVDSDVLSPIAGTVLHISIKEGQTVPVGTELAVVGVQAETRRHTSSPLVRRLAAESGVAMQSIVGSGPSGRVTRADVHSAASVPHKEVAAPAVVEVVGDRREPMGRVRRVIAARMMSSLQTSAQLTTVVEVDVTAVVSARERLNSEGATISLTAFFARAAVESLRAHPMLNASIDADGLGVVYHSAHHLGIAVDTQDGLMVPVVRDAGDLSLVGLARRIAELADRARKGKLRPDDMTGATFTVTNTGSRGALFDTPILSPGQTGILATGAVVERPVVKIAAGGQRSIAISSMMYLALTYDHRLVDGADAARFLTSVRALLEFPSSDNNRA